MDGIIRYKVLRPDGRKEYESKPFAITLGDVSPHMDNAKYETLASISCYTRRCKPSTDCVQLVKMVSAPEECPTFANYFDDITILQGNFHYSEFIHIF
ncbi:hypothetical protein Bca4012_030418 [Brassica carinata]